MDPGRGDRDAATGEMEVAGLRWRACLVGGALLLAASPALTQTRVSVRVDASKPGAKIDRDIFGQFAEHLGAGVYGGVWVGKDSKIPNVRGIRSDVVTALK